MRTEEECIDGAGRVLAWSDAAMAEMTPREQAEAAWTPGCGLTVEELEAQIRAERGITDDVAKAS